MNYITSLLNLWRIRLANQAIDHRSSKHDLASKSVNLYPMPTIINLFQGLKAYPSFYKQLTCNELLFTNYDCPQPEGKQSFFIEQNLILYVISGRRIFHKGVQTWEMSKGVCSFVKKGTHISERILD